MRLAAFIGVLAAILVGWSLHSASAQLDELLLRVGDRMMVYDDARRQDERRALVFNGQELFMRSGTTEHDVDTVLTFYQQMCRQNDGRTLEQLLAMPGFESLPDDAETGFLEATRRHDAEDIGYVVCLDTGSEDALEPSEILERLEAFVESGDISDVGDMRYAFARRGRDYTHFMVFWTEGPFNVKDMFPAEGDAPGRDVEGIPRPPQARRVLSSWERGVPYALTMYEGSRMDQLRLEAWYRARLPDMGWSILDPAPAVAKAANVDPDRFLVVENGNRLITLVFTLDPEVGGMTTVISSE